MEQNIPLYHMVQARAQHYRSQVLISSTLYVCIFHAKFLVPKITKLCFGFEVLTPKILYKKCMRIMLMKLTAVNTRLVEDGIAPTDSNILHPDNQGY
jgi:hypothetical protein